MDLFDLLACPVCRSALARRDAALDCAGCAARYPIVRGVPILLPGGRAREVAHEQPLHVRDGYDPWVHRVVLESLPPDAVSLEIGAGNMALDVPNVVRTDVKLTPHVDVVADAHALPFRAGAFAFVFSLAVVEHLRDPFLAAREMERILVPGGYVYGECSFVFPYHGYPHHYFNASPRGLPRIFAGFAPIRAGVAPYQMPSFAVRAVLEGWVRDLDSAAGERAARVRSLVAALVAEPLGDLDARLTAEAACRCAAGTYFLGQKPPATSAAVISTALRDLHRRSPALGERFPIVEDLGAPANLLRWARGEGARLHAEIAADLASRIPFRKRAGEAATPASLGAGPGVDEIVADSALEGWIDGAAVHGGDRLLVAGWAADGGRGAPVARVEIHLDGEARGEAVLGGERGDVARVTGRADYQRSGWSAAIALEAVAPGHHRVSAIAHGAAGTRAVLAGAREIEIPHRRAAAAAG